MNDIERIGVPYIGFISCPSVLLDEIRNKRFDLIVKDENYYREQKKLRNRIHHWYVVKVHYTLVGRMISKIRFAKQSIKYKLRRGWMNE